MNNLFALIKFFCWQKIFRCAAAFRSALLQFLPVLASASSNLFTVAPFFFTLLPSCTFYFHLFSSETEWQKEILLALSFLLPFSGFALISSPFTPSTYIIFLFLPLSFFFFLRLPSTSLHLPLSPPFFPSLPSFLLFLLPISPCLNCA